MNEIWVVSETVDLGSHTVCAFHSELNAIAETARLNAEYREKMRKILIEQYNYTEEEFKRHHRDLYFYESVSIID